MSQNPYAPGYDVGVSGGAPKTSVLAILSLVLVLLSPIGCCGTVMLFTVMGAGSFIATPALAAVGVLMAVVALVRIKGSGGRKTGSGMAITAIVIGMLIGIASAALSIGAWSGIKWFTGMMSAPTTMMTSADATQARGHLNQTLASQVTDADWTRFQSEVAAELGTIQPLPSNPMAVLRQYSEVGNMMQNQQGRNAMPIPLIGDKGKGVLWLHMPRGGSNTPPSQNPGEFFLSLAENMSAVLPSGKEVWLVNPETVKTGPGPVAPIPLPAPKP